MYNYAQVDLGGIVVGIAQLSNKVNSSNLIEIDSYDVSLLNSKYNSGTRKFEVQTVPFKTLYEIQQNKINELNQKCFDLICGGFKSYALGIEHTYPSDIEAQANLQMAIKRLEIDLTKTKIGFKTLDAGYLDHTLDQLHKVFSDGFDFGQQQIIKYNQLKIKVQNALTMEEVNGIVW